MNEHDHFGPDCPECRAASETCKIIGGFAEVMQKMLDDGYFERLGFEMAMRREEAVLAAFLGDIFPKPLIVDAPTETPGTR